MDSIAYSVFLEVNTDFSNVNKELKKSLNMVNDFGSQITDTYSHANRWTKSMLDSHTGINKKLEEEAGWLDKAWYYLGAMAKELAMFPVTITKAFATLSMVILGAISEAAVQTYEYISDWVAKAQSRYEDYVNQTKTANYAVAGGFTELHDRMTGLMGSMGATFGQAQKIVVGMREVGLTIQDLGADYASMVNTLYAFEKITGINAKTAASYVKTMTALGKTNAQAENSLKKMAVGMGKANLTTEEMNQLVGNLQSEMYDLEFAFGTDAIDTYRDSLIDFAGAAKMAGVNMGEVTGLMSALNKDPLKFVVALGSDALHKSAGENLEGLVDNLDQMRATLDGMPPGLKPQMLQSIYGLTTAQFKALEGVEEFREKFPVINEFSQLFERATHSLTEFWQMIKNKVMAVFEKLGGRFREAYMDLAKISEFATVISEKVQKLTNAIFKFINEAFGADLFAMYSDEVKGAVVSLSRYIGEVLDKTTQWVNELDRSMVKRAMQWIADKFIEIKQYAIEVKDAIVEWYEDGGLTEAWNTIKSIGKAIKDWIIDPMIWVAGVTWDIAVAMYEWSGPIWQITKQLFDLGVLVLEAFLVPFKVFWDIFIASVSFIGKLVDTLIIKPLSLFFSVGSAMWSDSVVDSVAKVGEETKSFTDSVTGVLQSIAMWLYDLKVSGNYYYAKIMKALDYIPGVDVDEDVLTRDAEGQMRDRIIAKQGQKAWDDYVKSKLGFYKKEEPEEVKVQKQILEQAKKQTKVSQDTNDAIEDMNTKSEKAVGYTYLSDMDSLLNTIGETYTNAKGEEALVSMEKLINDRIAYEKNMAERKGVGFDEAQARSRIGTEITEGYQRRFFVALKEMQASKDIGTDEATLKQYLVSAIQSGRDVKQEELFNKLSTSAQEQFLITQRDFQRLATTGGTALLDKHLKSAMAIDEKTIAKIENASQKAEAKEVKPASGTKAEHAAKNAASSPALESAMKANAESASKIAEGVVNSNSILEDIRENTGKKSFSATRADYNEVTASTWGQ